MLSIILDIVFISLCFTFGWKASTWRVASKKLKAENQRLKEEICAAVSENKEMRLQLSLPPERRFALDVALDPGKTISDERMKIDRSTNQASLGGVDPMIIIAASAAMLATRPKVAKVANDGKDV
jgi:hypothetical protein